MLLDVVDNKEKSLKTLSSSTATVIMFICNHCPYVKAIEDRLIVLANDLKAHKIHTVAICSNDPANYPEDNFENLQKRWKAKNYSFTYLHDPEQTAAKTFGAVCTPDFFLFDGHLKLKYRGRLDDAWKDPSAVTRRELYEAALALQKNEKIPFPEIPSMGCSIKWI
jgi:thiol-disulfide isomerase/thioredoxin